MICNSGSWSLMFLQNLLDLPSFRLENLGAITFGNKSQMTFFLNACYFV